MSEQTSGLSSKAVLEMTVQIVAASSNGKGIATGHATELIREVAAAIREAHTADKQKVNG